MYEKTMPDREKDPDEKCETRQEVARKKRRAFLGVMCQQYEGTGFKVLDSVLPFLSSQPFSGNK